MEPGNLTFTAAESSQIIKMLQKIVLMLTDIEKTCGMGKKFSCFPGHQQLLTFLLAPDAGMKETAATKLVQDLTIEEEQAELSYLKKSTRNPSKPKKTKRLLPHKFPKLRHWPTRPRMAHFFKGDQYEEVMRCLRCPRNTK